MDDRSTVGTNKTHRGRKSLLFTGVLAAAGVLVVLTGGYAIGQARAGAKAQPPRALLRVSARTPRILPGGPDEPENYSRFLNTQMALIKSPFVVEPAVQSPEVAKLSLIKNQTDPAAWLEQLIRVTAVPETEVLWISVDVADRSQAAVLVNAIVKSYLRNVVESTHLSNLKRLEQLQTMWNKKQEELKSKRKSIRKLSEEAGSDDRATLELGRDLHLDDLRAAHVALRKTRLDKVAAETRLARKRVDKATTAPEIAAVEETVAILTAQEKYLLSVEKERSETLATLNVHTMDLEAERDEIRLFQETTTKIGREVEALGLQLEAPKRIKQLTEARP